MSPEGSRHAPEMGDDGRCPKCGRPVQTVDPLGFARAGYDMDRLTDRARSTLYLRHVGARKEAEK